MNVLKSNPKDCYQLAVKIKRILENKVNFDSSIYTTKVFGKYYLDSSSNLDSNIVYFNFEFCQNKFLKIQFSNDNLIAKLSALSEFYLIFSELFKEPTLFYRNKTDNSFCIEWCFRGKNEIISYLERSLYIDHLIIFKMKKSLNQVFKDTVGLPYPLLYLLQENKKSNYSTLKLQK